jgi:hypothetical protein
MSLGVPQEVKRAPEGRALPRFARIKKVRCIGPAGWLEQCAHP